MNQEINEIIDIIENFHENYQAETIEDFPVNFSNDTLLLIKEFKNNATNENASDLKKVYEDFMLEILKFDSVLKEHQSFAFSTIKSFEALVANDEIENLEPVYTHYSFTEVEEIIEQMFDEIKNIKESQDELKEELVYILEDYLFHIEYLEDNMQYNYFIYDELQDIEDEEKLEKAIVTLREEKKILHDKFEQKLKSKK
ncbi:hypothetical protein EG240_07260 [Paenimyroides tangerinum]|uniref:Uncharacterized protein n=1 Tax=Paenimyroides tangerinum TaxID=2488728 RepID=A0A3P3W745_9FLAO|nr:hypothetical protein [Paenimyroides tangerinum]RRJ90992.1 hypothetical protein EG240_07260 [Paenimyroides tangerinum]